MHSILRSYRRASLLVVALTFWFSAVAAAAQADARIVGRVVDPDGRPVAGATVIVEGPGPAPRTVVADAAGRFGTSGLAAGRYRVRASSTGLAAGPVDVRLGAGGSEEIELRTRLTAVDEQLTVTATQVDTPLSRVPDSTTVISGAEVQTRQQFALGQVLRSAPGVTVQQSGGPGSVTSLFIRGSESDQTLVLVDGVRANAFGGGIDLSQIPLADVERVEIVRGPQSALYGADAIGGVVHLLTRQGGTPRVDGSFEFGSRAMRRATGSTTGSINALRWHLGGDYFEDEGYTGLASNGETVSNDDAAIGQVAGTLGWIHAASGGDLQGSVRYVDTERGTPGPFGSDPAGRFFGVDRTSRNLTTRTTGALRWIQPWFGASSRVRQRVEFDVADYDLTYLTPSSPPPFDRSDGETVRQHLRVQTDAAAGAALGFTGGLEWLGEQGGSTYIVSGDPSEPMDVDRSVLGLFGEARWSPLARFSLSAGVRGERIHRGALPGDPLAFTPRPDFPAETITSVNPKIAASWGLAGDPGSRASTRLHGAIGTGIRPPDAFEMAFTDNSGLKPERSRSADVGVEQTLAEGRVQFDATAFFNRFDDLIISVGRSFAGSSRWRTDNISNAQARGVELSGGWRPVRAVDLKATYTFTSSEILAVDNAAEAPPPYAVGDPLLRRPRNQGSLDLIVSQARWSAFAQLMLRGETLDAEPAFGPTGGLYTNDGYALTNLGASWQAAPWMSVQGRILNAFDTAYEEILGYPSPGRTAYVGVRVTTRR
jgi:outer membrane cobalamin receptor